LDLIGGVLNPDKEDIALVWEERQTGVGLLAAPDLNRRVGVDDLSAL
jgi:hypothetical protein